MIASPPPAFVRASGNRRRAFGFANALRAFGILGLTVGITLPQIANAQSSDAATVPVPTMVLHLRPENAAPSRAALHERLLTRLKVHGEVLLPKGGEAPVIRFSREVSPPVRTKTERDEVRKRYLAAHPTSIAEKQATETMKASDNALLAKVATKSKSDHSLLNSVIAATLLADSQPLLASLSLNQPADASGRAYITLVAPKNISKPDNLVIFQNHDDPFGFSGTGAAPAAPVTDGFGHSFTPIDFPTYGFMPDSYLHVEMKAKAGSMYLVAVKASWGTFPYDPAKDAPDVNNAIVVLCADSGISGIADTTQGKSILGDTPVKTIPGGTPVTPMVVLCDRDGWYDITIAGMSNAWDFRGVNIKEITAD